MSRTPHATTPVGAVLARAIRRNGRRATADWSKAAEGDSTAIHDVRVASRRVRAALPIASAALGADTGDALRVVRRVTRALGRVREADVVGGVLETVTVHGPAATAAIARATEECARRRDRDLRSARADLARIDAADLLAHLRSLAASLASTDHSAAPSIALATETRRRLRDFAGALARAGTVYAVNPWHQVRLTAKKLRYALEVAAAIPDAAARRAARRLQDLQERLGRLHDIQMTQQFLRTVAPSAGSDPLLSAELVKIDRGLEARCRRAHAEILRTRPQLERLVQDIDRMIAQQVMPRRVGRLARMRMARPARRAAAS